MDVDDIEEAAKIASLSSLPQKSRDRYEFTYGLFKKWCCRKNVTSVTEKVMLAYMLERTQQLKSPASLWCEYSMLKATIKCKENIDISKFPQLIGFLKNRNKGYIPKKSQVLEREHILKFLAQAEDVTYLLIKVTPFFS